jgi:bifunctional glutamyl/prolyl-tRNA synthetase
MVHGDNKGLVLPPRVSKIQVVMVPVGVNEKNKEKVLQATNEYQEIFSKAGIRIKIDNRDNYTAGWKFNDWELKGVPIRIEIGPRDIDKNEFVAVRRDTGEKIPLKKEGCVEHLTKMLETIQSNMLERATAQLNDNMTVTTSWLTFTSMLDQQKIIQAPFCGEIKCEEKIKKDSAREEAAEAGAPSMGAKGLCIPFTQPAPITNETCICPDCDHPAKYYTLFGRSY